LRDERDGRDSRFGRWVVLFGPVREAGAGHALAQAALFEKIFYQPAELLVNQVIGLMNQADGNLGDGFPRAGLHEFAVKLVGLRDLAAQPPDIEGFPGVLVPFAVVAHAQVVAVVVQQFLDEMTNELGQGNRLEFRDFGVFEIRDRKKRVAQNPKTLERVEVPAYRTVRFKVGRLMKVTLQKGMTAPPK